MLIDLFLPIGLGAFGSALSGIGQAQCTCSRDCPVHGNQATGLNAARAAQWGPGLQQRTAQRLAQLEYKASLAASGYYDPILSSEPSKPKHREYSGVDPMKNTVTPKVLK